MSRLVNPPLKQVFIRLLFLRLFIPITILGIATIAVSFYFIYNTANQDLIQNTNLVASRTDDFLINSVRVLKSVALVINDIPEDSVDEFLWAALQSNPYFDTIYTINADGHIYAISPRDPAYLGLDMSDQDYFKNRKKISSYQVSSPFISPKSGYLTVYVSIPLNSEGLIVGELNLKKLQTTVQNVTVQSWEKVYIMDNQGTLLAHPTQEVIEQQINYHDLNTEQNGNQKFSELALTNFQPILVAKSAVTTANWSVVSEINLIEANKQVILLLIFLIGGLFLFGYYLTISINSEGQKRIVIPVSRLSYSANALASNENINLNEQKLLEGGFKEIVDLAGNLKKMWEGIQNWQAKIVESEAKYRSLIEQSIDAIVVEYDEKIVIANPAFTQIFGIDINNIEQQSISLIDIATSESRQIIMEQRQKILTQQIRSTHYDFSAKNAKGQIIEIEAAISALYYQSGIAVQSILRDITERKRTEQNEREQRLFAEALRDTASALNSTLDLNEVMDRILHNIKKVIHYDAGVIMLLDEDRRTIRIRASHGYKERGLSEWQTRVRLDLFQTPNLLQMYQCGSAIAIPCTKNNKDWVMFEETRWQASQAGAPICVKDQVIGFISLDSETPGYYDKSQANRLQAFADQAGTAIQNAQLIQAIRKSNVELKAAYETTLKGWSKALELRDYETEGHSQRVLDLTVQLALKMGVSGNDLVNIRYGTLMHDIGKIAIPDSILFKPGPLDEDEWEIMRRHPVYAFHILSPIPYLAGALDIPLYHHEHWNGKGYPQRLEKEQIPLAARIFAVVDVWDGLRSDRPYRAGIPEEDVIQYIKDQSGQQFDPAVVDAFIQLIELERPPEILTS